MIDAFGALITSISLIGILAPFEQYFGMPKNSLTLLSGIAFCLFTYSISCHELIKSNWKPFLSILIICNIIYLTISIGLIIKHSEKITELGWLYFVLELIIVGVVISLEYKSLLNQIRSSKNRKPTGNNIL